MHPRLIEQMAYEHTIDLRTAAADHEPAVLEAGALDQRAGAAYVCGASRLGAVPALRRSMGQVLVRLGSRIGGLEGA